MTTGSLRSSQVIEVAVLDKRGDLLFHSLFRPTTSIDPFVSAIHGLSWKDVKDAPTFDLLSTDLYECLRGRLVLALAAAGAAGAGAGGSELGVCTETRNARTAT